MRKILARLRDNSNEPDYPVSQEGPVSQEAGPVPAGRALQELIFGNSRYANGKSSRAHLSPARRNSLVSEQKPHTIIFGCSDSRVPPEVVFDQGLGDVFVVRTAGEVPDESAIASIEYALQNLGSHLLIILGHESCGAVKAALKSEPGQSAGSPALDHLISMIRPHVCRHASSEDPTFRSAVKAHVDGVATELLGRSAIIRSAVQRGALQLARGIYGLADGRVEFWSRSRVDLVLLNNN